MPDVYYHHAKQVFDTGLEMELLQEYVMISLDFFQKCMQNKAIETELEAWLMFLSSDDPERIMELITAYPEFKAILPLKRLPKQVRAFTARTVRK